jgi:hypothetical protein
VTQDEIIEMAREAGGSDVGGHGWTTWVGTQSTEFLERFANLVAAKEREACANVCETLWNTPTNGMATEEEAYGDECAAAIRARGQA